MKIGMLGVVFCMVSGAAIAKRNGALTVWDLRPKTQALSGTQKDSTVLLYLPTHELQPLTCERAGPCICIIERKRFWHIDEILFLDITERIQIAD